MSLLDRVHTFESRLYTRLRARADRRRTLPPHLLTGERGEDAAYFHLRSHGYTVVARRWRTRRLRGDLDLLAWDGDTLVAFEVKTRTAHDLVPAEEAIDRDKRNQLRRQMRQYLHGFPEHHRERIPVRFDILSVYLLGDATEIEHYPQAFPFAAPREDWPQRRF